MPKKYVIAGFIGAFSLLAFYFLTMRLLEGSWGSAVYQFKKLWLFMIILSFGFGIQVGLYSYLRKLLRGKSSGRIMGTSTATSGIGMIACCAHHVSDVLPLFGFTILSVFLIKYQSLLLLLGIISNLFGIVYLIKLARRFNGFNFPRKNQRDGSYNN